MATEIHINEIQTDNSILVSTTVENISIDISEAPKGDQGDQGEIGYPAFLYDSRRVGENQYTIGEIVSYQGSYYICISNNDAIIPGIPGSEEYWETYSFIGPAGPNSVTSETFSDGTADLSVSALTVESELELNATVYSYSANALEAHRIALNIDELDNTSDLDKPISTATQNALDDKVDKITGKGLSDENYTSDEKTKLSGIADGAEVNVNADWEAVSGDAEILNKPVLGSAAAADTTDFATFAQGELADSALQPQSVTYLGEYNDGFDYTYGDVVIYGGLLYIRVGEPNTGYPPGSSYWEEYEPEIGSPAYDLYIQTNLANKTNIGHGHAISDIADLQDSLDNKQDAGDYATLVDGKVPSEQLPSYVDDVLEYADFEALPETGSAGIIYVTLDTNKTYRWSGSTYIEISAGPSSTDAVPEGNTNLYYTDERASAAAPVQSVNGYTDIVTLTAADVGLGNVDNTSDLDKPISTATQDALDLKSDIGHTHDWDDITTGNVTVVPFDTTTAAVAAVGQLTWNDEDGTLDLGLKGGNVTLQIGQESVVRVVNKTNTNLLESEYKAVRIRSEEDGGAQGQRLAVVLAQANNDPNSVDTLGLVTENISNNGEGFITTSGLVRGINTTGILQGETWETNDVLYLSPTIAGRITNIKPQAPNHTVVVGFVVHAHQNQGKIFVKVDNGYEIDELHNVKITDVAPNDVLSYDGVQGVWKNTDNITLNSISANSIEVNGDSVSTANDIIEAKNFAIAMAIALG